jgi:hypothetical protein
MIFFYPNSYRERGANVQNLFDPMVYDLIDGLTTIPVKPCVLQDKRLKNLAGGDQ